MRHDIDGRGTQVGAGGCWSVGGEPGTLAACSALALARTTSSPSPHPTPQSEAAPHLLFHNFSTPLGERVKCILQHLFPPPKPDTRRVLTFGNDGDYISFRHHTYSAPPGASSGGNTLRPADVTLAEVGPRFELRPYRIALGTLDTPDAETEWVLRPYMNTARKKQAL